MPGAAGSRVQFKCHLNPHTSFLKQKQRRNKEKINHQALALHLLQQLNLHFLAEGTIIGPCSENQHGRLWNRLRRCPESDGEKWAVDRWAWGSDRQMSGTQKTKLQSTHTQKKAAPRPEHGTWSQHAAAASQPGLWLSNQGKNVTSAPPSLSTAAVNALVSGPADILS